MHYTSQHSTSSRLSLVSIHGIIFTSVNNAQVL
jgi:hypothetical protein